LVVTHHPLWLRGVTSIAASHPKGRVAHTLIRNGIALHTCHTNADSPAKGVSESLALALGLSDIVALRPDPVEPYDKWVVFVPLDAADAVADAMHDAGAGVIGNYDRALFVSTGTGSFRARDGAHPAFGAVGELERIGEARLEMVAHRSLRDAIRVAMLAAHPYEEVAHDILESHSATTDRGSGRIGRLAEPMSLAAFAEQVRDRLPAHGGATRVAGDLDATVEIVALCGGSGDFLIGDAQSRGADVYVTSDLRHHRVSEHFERPGACAVIDVPHWAAEWTWLPVAAAELGALWGDTVTTHISTLVTDPWSMSLAGTVRRSPN
jgi:putative NIF3 family GTP cyclohydrolase 1 type 2